MGNQLKKDNDETKNNNAETKEYADDTMNNNAETMTDSNVNNDKMKKTDAKPKGGKTPPKTASAKKPDQNTLVPVLRSSNEDVPRDQFELPRGTVCTKKIGTAMQSVTMARVTAVDEAVLEGEETNNWTVPIWEKSGAKANVYITDAHGNESMEPLRHQLSGTDEKTLAAAVEQFSQMGLERIHHYALNGEFLHAFYKQKKLIDLLIHINDRNFIAHRIVLCSHSKFFCDLLLDSDIPPYTVTDVTLKGVHADVFKRFIHFAYTGNLYVGPENFHAFRNLAKQLQSDSLKTKLNSFIAKFNVMPLSKAVAVLTELKRNEEDIPLALDVMKRHFSALLNGSDKLAHLTEEDFKELISLDDINVNSELDVFWAVLFWVAMDPEKRIQYLEEMMSSVRFTSMSSLELMDCARASEMVKLSKPCKDMLIRANWVCHVREIGLEDPLNLPEHRKRTSIAQGAKPPTVADFDLKYLRYKNLMKRKGDNLQLVEIPGCKTPGPLFPGEKKAEEVPKSIPSRKGKLGKKTVKGEYNPEILPSEKLPAPKKAKSGGAAASSPSEKPEKSPKKGKEKEGSGSKDKKSGSKKTDTEDTSKGSKDKSDSPKKEKKKKKDDSKDESENAKVVQTRDHRQSHNTMSGINEEDVYTMERTDVQNDHTTDLNYSRKSSALFLEDWKGQHNVNDGDNQDALDSYDQDHLPSQENDLHLNPSTETHLQENRRDALNIWESSLKESRESMLLSQSVLLPIPTRKTVLTRSEPSSTGVNTDTRRDNLEDAHRTKRVCDKTFTHTGNCESLKNKRPKKSKNYLNMKPYTRVSDAKLEFSQYAKHGINGDNNHLVAKLGHSGDVEPSKPMTDVRRTPSKIQTPLPLQTETGYKDEQLNIKRLSQQSEDILQDISVPSNSKPDHLKDKFQSVEEKEWRTMLDKKRTESELRGEKQVFQSFISSPGISVVSLEDEHSMSYKSIQVEKTYSPGLDEENSPAYKACEIPSNEQIGRMSEDERWEAHSIPSPHGISDRSHNVHMSNQQPRLTLKRHFPEHEQSRSYKTSMCDGGGESPDHDVSPGLNVRHCLNETSDFSEDVHDDSLGAESQPVFLEVLDDTLQSQSPHQDVYYQDIVGMEEVPESSKVSRWTELPLNQSSPSVQYTYGALDSAPVQYDQRQSSDVTYFEKVCSDRVCTPDEHSVENENNGINRTNESDLRLSESDGKDAWFVCDELKDSSETSRYHNIKDGLQYCGQNKSPPKSHSQLESGLKVHEQVLQCSKDHSSTPRFLSAKSTLTATKYEMAMESLDIIDEPDDRLRHEHPSGNESAKSVFAYSKYETACDDVEATERVSSKRNVPSSQERTSCIVGGDGATLGDSVFDGKGLGQPEVFVSGQLGSAPGRHPTWHTSVGWSGTQLPRTESSTNPAAFESLLYGLTRTESDGNAGLNETDLTGDTKHRKTGGTGLDADDNDINNDNNSNGDDICDDDDYGDNDDNDINNDNNSNGDDVDDHDYGQNDDHDKDANGSFDRLTDCFDTCNDDDNDNLECNNEWEDGIVHDFDDHGNNDVKDGDRNADVNGEKCSSFGDDDENDTQVKCIDDDDKNDGSDVGDDGDDEHADETWVNKERTT